MLQPLPRVTFQLQALLSEAAQRLLPVGRTAQQMCILGIQSDRPLGAQQGAAITHNPLWRLVQGDA